MKSRNHRGNLFIAIYMATSLLTTGSIAQVASPKKTIATETDMPRFTYPASLNSLELIKADDAAFQPFLDRFADDVDGVLNDYDVRDKATLRRLLDDKEGIELLRRDLNGASATGDRTAPEHLSIEVPETRSRNLRCHPTGRDLRSLTSLSLRQMRER